MKRFTGGAQQERNELTTIYDRLRKRSYRRSGKWYFGAVRNHAHKHYMEGVKDALYAIAGMGDE